jgi:hypothetical protein
VSAGADWKAGALLYSGRPDPSWTMAPDAAGAWVHAFERLTPTDAALPNQARLGYRGAWLQEPAGRRWNAFAELAWCASDRRVDVARALERRLLESAPTGALPAGWRDWLFDVAES